MDHMSKSAGNGGVSGGTSHPGIESGPAPAAGVPAVSVESVRLELAIVTLEMLASAAHELRLLVRAHHRGEWAGEEEAGAMLCAIANTAETMGLQADLVLRRLGKPGCLGDPELWAFAGLQHDLIERIRVAAAHQSNGVHQ